MTGVMAEGLLWRMRKNGCFCYYGQTVEDIIKSHNSTLVGQVSAQVYMRSHWPYPFPVYVATLIYVFWDKYLENGRS